MKVAADDRLQSERRQQRGRGVQANQLFGIAAPGQRERVACGQREVAEHLLPLLHFEESRIREPDAGEVLSLVGGREPHQSIGLVIGQRPQEHGVDNAEERDIGADGQRERADDHSGEHALPGEEPKRVANVAAKVIEERAVTAGTNDLFDALDATDFGEGETASLGGETPSRILSAVDISTNDRISSSSCCSMRSRRRIQDAIDANRRRTVMPPPAHS